MCTQSSLGANTSHLQRISCEDASVLHDVASNDKADVGSVIVDDDTREVLAVSFNYLRTKWQAISPEVCVLLAWSL